MTGGCRPGQRSQAATAGRALWGDCYTIVIPHSYPHVVHEGVDSTRAGAPAPSEKVTEESQARISSTSSRGDHCGDSTDRDASNLNRPGATRSSAFLMILGVSAGHRSLVPGRAAVCRRPPGLTRVVLPRTVGRSLWTSDRCLLPPSSDRRAGSARVTRSPSKIWEFSREQAHFPAQPPASQPDPRLPSADEHPCGSRHPRRAAPQGPL